MTMKCVIMIAEKKKKEASEMSFKIDPAMSYHEAVEYYGKYVTATKAAGKKPVSFLHFITGRL